MNKLLFVFGTRPEAIKMAPLIYKFKKSEAFETRVCVTAQHRSMLDEVLGFFHIEPDYDLNLMKPDQSLFDITADGLKGLRDVFAEYGPDHVFVQGDTTTAFIGALAGFYVKAKVSHIEAGLRSGNKFSPYPEEINRVMAGHLADYHFAPTSKAAANLRNEGIRENVWVVGNTVIDALFLALGILQDQGDEDQRKFFGFADFSKKIILMTCHRRETFGEKFENVCSAVKELSESFDDIEIIYPVHLNPHVTEPAHRILGNRKNIHLVKPLSYPQLVWLMSRSYFILTDSGGIQEEAPSLGKPVLVMRDVTERTESIEAGASKLVGTRKETILREAAALLTDHSAYDGMSKVLNPYGDGTASEQVVAIVSELSHGETGRES